jgi:hypothetical protein
MSIDGRTGKNAPFKIKITPDKKGTRPLSIMAKNAGAFQTVYGCKAVRPFRRRG